MDFTFAKFASLSTAALAALAGATAIIEMKVPSLILGLLLVLTFIAMVVSIFSLMPDNKMMSFVSVIFAGMYGVLISFNYALQLSFIGRQIPVPESFNMENPESIFWTIEVLGYFFMGLSTALLVPLFHSSTVDRAIQLFFLINSILGIGGLIGYWLDFPIRVMLGGLMVWNIIFPIAALLVYFHFRKQEKSEQLEKV